MGFGEYSNLSASAGEGCYDCGGGDTVQYGDEMRRDEATALLVTRPILLALMLRTRTEIEPSAQLASLVSNVKQKHKMSFFILLCSNSPMM